MYNRIPRNIDARLAETNHRVANSLQLTASLLTRDAGKVADPAARTFLGAAATRVRAIALLHRALTGPAEGDFAFDAYLHAVLDTVRTTFCAERGIRLLAQVDPVEIDPDRAITLGLALHELVTNAVQHAFGGREAGTVQVACGYDCDGSIWIEVEDDGIGMPAGYALRRGASGVGMAVTLLASVDGTLALGDPPSGTKMIIKLPANLRGARAPAVSPLKPG